MLGIVAYFLGRHNVMSHTIFPFDPKVTNDGFAPWMTAGSKDTTLIIWDIVGISRTGRLRTRISREGASSSLPLRPTPRHVLHGHEDAITCLALAPELDLVVSAAADGNLLFHTLAAGRYARILHAIAS